MVAGRNSFRLGARVASSHVRAERIGSKFIQIQIPVEIEIVEIIATGFNSIFQLPACASAWACGWVKGKEGKGKGGESVLSPPPPPPWLPTKRVAERMVLAGVQYKMMKVPRPPPPRHNITNWAAESAFRVLSLLLPSPLPKQASKQISRLYSRYSTRRRTPGQKEMAGG